MPVPISSLPLVGPAGDGPLRVAGGNIELCRFSTLHLSDARNILVMPAGPLTRSVTGAGKTQPTMIPTLPVFTSDCEVPVRPRSRL
jgi:hypothetical protein